MEEGIIPFKSGKEEMNMTRHLARLRNVFLISILLLFMFNNVGSQPVLNVTVTGDTSVNMCEQHDYTITVQTNETAANVVVVASLPTIVGQPDGFTIIDNGGGTESDSDGDGVNDTITWSVGTLDPLSPWSATITVYITCTAVSGEIFVNATHDAGASQGCLC